ncbi:hypothetical protein [Dyadobacter sandarakinus]|uniref:Uncharacterized protein n=1 Tax=Dyadobacter sandarakinus TaxID=2747268 RepID=A0ABX7I582_9BACT|nr:hypothetical protein [Dyadobacter sandarakinus]QRR01256.1 hypothetical protein HWI92_10240 [Dyadobacter sandarakinus]
MTDQQDTTDTLRQYQQALRQHKEGAALKLEAQLFKNGLDAQLCGKRILLTHHQDQLARIKSKGAINGNIEVYAENLFTTQHRIQLVAEQIDQLEKRIGGRK